MKRIVTSKAILITFFVSALVLIIVAVTAGKIMLDSAEMLEESVQHEMQALSRAVAFMATADELNEYQSPPDMQKPGYTELRLKLNRFSQEAGLPYAYFMRYDAETGMMLYIVDNVLTPGDDQDGLDSPPVVMEDGQEIALKGRAATAELGDYLAGWDGLMTAWAPVYYNDGSLSNIVACVDTYDIYIKKAYTNMQLLSWLLALSIIVVLLSSFLSLRLYRRKARQSEIANLAKSNFLSRMSHEMRTPMHAILGLSDLAENTSDVVKIKEYIGNAKVSAQHLHQLIEDVLDISGIETGKLQYETTPISIAMEMDKIDSIIRPQAEAKKQDFSIKIQPGVPEYVMASGARIRQVLINILSNAIKFTPKDGVISLNINVLNTHDNKYELEWRIKDNGIGISEATRARLFVPFEQGDNSSTRQYGGSGLGLAIAYQMTTLMGGELTVESSVGNGSEFILKLWLEKIDMAVAANANAKTGFNLAGRRVLLVEDTEINRLIFEDMFTEYGAKIDIAHNGLEGVERYTANPDKYDIIFMDIQMPVMDGYEAAQRIRASNTSRAKTVPIVALTANSFKEDVEKAFTAGMNGHVSKPFNAAQIEQTVNNALNI